jgi:uncharacterized protein YraI
MNPKAIIMAALLALAPPLASGTGQAADYLGKGHVPAPEEVLRIGPGHAYNVITRIRAGTSPRIKFCEHRGKWCYGAYGRHDGWVYAGPHPKDHWFRWYPAGH